MLGKVTLEDHFATPATLGDSQVFGAHVWSELGPRLIDFQDKRLRLMDASGVELMIVSLNAPAVQAIHDVAQAVATARAANDLLAEEVRKRPNRFAGLAALPMQDPEAAANELERCVRGLGFKGALVNGFSQVGAPDKITTCRSTAHSGPWSSASTFRSICTRAIPCPPALRPTTAINGCSGRPGHSTPRPRCMRCG
jgi:gamma-resorcylate decarboxylase